jgi:hypothetical protein
MKENISDTYNIRKTIIWIVLVYLAVIITSLIKIPHYSPQIVIMLIILPFLAYFVTAYTHFAVLIYIGFLPLIQHISYMSFAEIGGFLITPHMIIQFILTLALLVKYAKDYDGIPGEGLNLLDKFFILLTVFPLLSLIFSYGLPINQGKKWLLFYTGILETISFYFIIKYYLKQYDEFKKYLILAFLFTSFTSLVVALVEFNYIGFNIVKIYISRMRFGYGYHNINLYGIQSAVLFPIAFYALISEEFKKYRIFAYASFIILTVLSILCFNRGTFIVMAIELFFMFFYKSNRKAIYVFLLIAVLAGIYFSDLLILYFSRFVGGKGASKNNPLLDASALYRIEAWKLGLNLLWKYPFGVGPGGFQNVWERFGPYPNVYLGTPHQLFLSVGVDYGLMALLVFGAVLAYAFYSLNKIHKTHAADVSLARILKISVIGYVVYGMITDGELSHLSGFTFPNNGYTLILFSVLAMASNFINKYKKNV